ncbi:MAG: hypothetical protein E6K76_10900 [Candidatus Eisenbacteria bacterium]|uniref:Outer membrane protein beta-barrel domain-containing protein n=1 Tax=Eiseniibacteriota bacterium TaxID=2212470 RepID=A0A538T0U7_UNCEI|nr:MAG: hypothetical protein E6K76_10900 [Candidatus Eisenbacteria bacterium]
MTRTVVRGFLAAIALAALPLTAFAQTSVVTAIGPRVGFSIDPDQFVVGGHLAVGPIAPSLMFVPSLDLGFGDNRTVVAGNFDLQYHFRTDSRWHPYLGAGMGISNETVERRSGNDVTASEVGGNVVFGAMAPTRSNTQFFSELKLGLGDIPSMKLIAGWNFGI